MERLTMQRRFSLRLFLWEIFSENNVLSIFPRRFILSVTRCVVSPTNYFELEDGYKKGSSWNVQDRFYDFLIASIVFLRIFRACLSKLKVSKKRHFWPIFSVFQNLLSFKNLFSHWLIAISELTESFFLLWKYSIPFFPIAFSCLFFGA